MALPLVGFAVGAVMGGMKLAIKGAAKRVVAQVGKDILAGTAKDAVIANAKTQAMKGLEKLASGKLSDAQALVINRLKSKPTRALYELASKEFGVTPNALRAVVKAFNQSAKAKGIAKGRPFTKLLQKATKKQALSALPDEIKTIRQLEGKVKGIVKRVKTFAGEVDNLSINNSVKNLLAQLQIMLDRKVYGSQGAFNKNLMPIKINTDIIGYFNDSRQYTKNSYRALEVLEQQLSYEFELGSDLVDVWLIDDGEGAQEWTAYSNNDVRRFVEDFRADVALYLYNTSTEITEKKDNKEKQK